MTGNDKRPTVTDQLRQAIKAWPFRQSDLARQADVEESSISRFVRGERGLNEDSINNLCHVLRLELCRTPTGNG
jgi:transcriptional regulator with XRE-family HTH domain